MKHIWRIVLMAILLLLTPGGSRTVGAVSPTQQAQAILESMSVAERVGQLFLVTFEGDSVTLQSDIADLILNYKVGGVVLLPQNDNVTGYGDPANAPQQAARLANDLQRLALTGALPEEEAEELFLNPQEVLPTPTPAPGEASLPLLIAVNREGQDLTRNAILNGLTAVPSNMAIGATWRPEFANAVGQIVGRELAGIGVNMLFGPALDVLENPSARGLSETGTGAFGGDPYWVGLMGQAYTSGVHVGSNGRIAVVAKHFPGKGSSDRPIAEEIPTVRKSLEQLKQIELAPFMAVTGSAATITGTVDALLTTHIRYQGFQGNIRATTAPVSLDPQALLSLMQLSEFARWRQAGGIIVSDALGVRGVERFYDDTGQEFPHRRVARDALLAGNDLLYLADFALSDAPYQEQLANIQDTIRWFQEKYETDPTFEQRTNEAVRHIIQLKLRLYEGDLSLANVLVEPSAVLTRNPQGAATLFDLAQSALTLISPSPGELAERLARPPGANERILIFTDVREVRQCRACPPQPIISTTALAERMLALYGPQASAQLVPEQISSFTFAELEAFLAARGAPIVLPPTPPSPTVTPDGDEEATIPAPTTTPPPGYEVQQLIGEADWIIFNLLDAETPQSAALNTFLAQRPDIVRSARVIVFAFGAPYHLDTTEISKLTAYFGVYSAGSVFIDAAVRALFQESLLSGASPVSIEGIGYNLFTQTQPAPNQVIALFIAEGDEVKSPPSAEPLAAAVGDTLRLQTGVILDHNRNPVPDGTLVQFIQRDRIQGLVNIIASVPTSNGVAALDYVLEASLGQGQFRITAVSGAADISQEVDISIQGDARVAIIVPTPAPTETNTPRPTPTATAEPTETPAPIATPMPATPTPPQEPGIRIELSEFLMFFGVLMGLLATGMLALLWSHQQPTIQLTQQVGLLLWGLVGGLVVYNYFALGLPGTAVLHHLGGWAGLFTTLGGGTAGLGLFHVLRK